MLVVVTGILFCLFLLFHLMNNLIIYSGEENFNFLVSSLEKIKPLIRILELALVSILAVHISNSVYLSFQSKKSEIQPACPVLRKQIMPRYHREQCSLPVYYLFLSSFIYQPFGLTFQITDDHSIYYDMVTNSAIGFGNIFITILYLTAMVILGFRKARFWLCPSNARN